MALRQDDSDVSTVTFNEEATGIGKSIVADLAQLMTQGLRFGLSVDDRTGMIKSITVARLSGNGPIDGNSLVPGRSDVEMIGNVPPIFVGSGSITYKDTLEAPTLLESLEMPSRVQQAQSYLAQLNELIAEVLQRVSIDPASTAEDDLWIRNAHRAILDETLTRVEDLSLAIDIKRPNLAAGATRAIYETFLISLAITRNPELAKRWIIHSTYRKAEHRRRMGVVPKREYQEKWDQIKYGLNDVVDFTDDRGWAKCILYQLDDVGKRRRISLEAALEVEGLRIVKEYGYFLHPIADVERLELGNSVGGDHELLVPLCNAVEFAGAIVTVTTDVKEVTASLPQTAQDDLRHIVQVIMERVERMLEQFGLVSDGNPL